MESMEKFAPLLKCGTEAEWFDMLLKFGIEYGYEKTLLALVPDRYSLHEGAFVRSNYPAQWRKTYDSAKLFNIDPVVIHCIKHSTPLIWEPGLFSGKLQKAMYEEACGYGIRAGVTLPFHGARGELGILCFVNDSPPDTRYRNEALHKLPLLSLLRDFAFDAAHEYAQAHARAEPIPAVTRRELECLKWYASGMNSWEISLILHCSQRTVNFHLGNARRKFGATSSRQAVVKAIRMGVIPAA